jgi:hypothetical protein
MEGKIMRVIDLGTVDAAETISTTIAKVTPGIRGRNAVLVLRPNSTFVGTVAFGSVDGDGTTQVNQVSGIAFTAGSHMQMRDVDMVTLARFTCSAYTAGSCQASLLIED